MFGSLGQNISVYKQHAWRRQTEHSPAVWLPYAHATNLMCTHPAEGTADRMGSYAPAAWWICSILQVLGPGTPATQQICIILGPGFS